MNPTNRIGNYPIAGFYSFDTLRWDLNLSIARGAFESGSLDNGMNLKDDNTGYTHSIYRGCDGVEALDPPAHRHKGKALEPERITARQIEAARRALTRHMKRSGQVWIRVYPDVPVSKKPLEVRMGSGKGTPEYWVVRIKPGRILFEVDGVSQQIAREALTLAAAKLPIKTRFIERIAG